MSDVVALIGFGLVVAGIAATVVWWQRERRHRIAESLARFLAANAGWQRTENLCGRSAQQLVDDTVATPRGDRRYGLEYVVTGPLTVEITGHGIRVGPESLFGRIGLTRGDDQLESDLFNRRFRVHGEDRTLTVQLLDADLQQYLLDGFTERRLEFRGDLFVLGGDPRERDPNLFGPIGDLPGLMHDARDLLAAVPAQFWRAVGADQRRAMPPPPPPAT